MSVDQDSPDLIFLGSVVPDEAEYRTPAFSRAGNSAQTGIIEGLKQVGRAPTRVISFQATPVFPRSRRWYITQRHVRIAGCKTVLIGYINLPLIKPLSITLSFYREIRRSLNDRRGTLLSYNFNSFIALPVAALGNKIRPVPILFDIDLPGQTVPNTWARRLDFRILKTLMKHVAAAVVITDQVSKDFLYHQPALTVEGGLSSQQANQYVAVRRDSATFNIVYAGALEKYNGIDVILDAIEGLADPGIRLHIAGNGSLRDEVQLRASKDSRIVFHGFLDPSSIAELYREASLLINHRSDHRIDSRYVFPSKLIEYLASGAPVISTMFRSLRSEYLPFVHLLRDESPEALQQAILAVKADPEAAWMRADRGRRFIHDHKMWHQHARRIVQFLEVTR